MSRMVVRACPEFDWFADRVIAAGAAVNETYIGSALGTGGVLVPLASAGVVRGVGDGKTYSGKYTGHVLGVRVEASTTGGTLVVNADLYGKQNGVWMLAKALNAGANISVAAAAKSVFSLTAGGHQAYYFEAINDMGAMFEAYTVLINTQTGTNLAINTFIGFQRK